MARCLVHGFAIPCDACIARDAALNSRPPAEVEAAEKRHFLPFFGGKGLVLPIWDEGERQAVLLALASLAAERPGWDDYLNRIAKRIDATFTHATGEERAELYDDFRALRRPR